MTTQEKLTRSERNLITLEKAQKLLEESQQQLNDLEFDKHDSMHIHFLVRKIKGNIEEAEAIIAAIKQSELV